jgi:hypothetical protein
VIGRTEYHIEGGGEPVWADGVDVDEGLIQEAKLILIPSASLYIPGSTAGQAARDGAERNLDRELERYADIIQDENNPIRGLEIVTSNLYAARWFVRKMKDHGIPGRVRVVQFGPFSTTGQPL